MDAWLKREGSVVLRVAIESRTLAVVSSWAYELMLYQYISLMDSVASLPPPAVAVRWLVESESWPYRCSKYW